MAILALVRNARRFCRRALLMAMVLSGSAAAVRAQEVEVPASVHVPVLLKVLSFDRQLHVRAPREIVIGVVFQRGNRTSVVAKDEVMQLLLLAKNTMDALPLRAVAVDLDRGTLEEALSDSVITHLYVTPLRAMDVRALAKKARAARVTTMTGVSRYVAEGLALGVGLRGERVRILINLESCRVEGADFSAEVLKLADLVP